MVYISPLVNIRCMFVAVALENQERIYRRGDIWVESCRLRNSEIGKEFLKFVQSLGDSSQYI